MDYANGKIYKIECSETGEVYFGSTCGTLNKRMSKHKDKFQQWQAGQTRASYTSFPLISRGRATISLVEDFACENKKQLHERERFYIENYECVNKFVPGRTMAEYSAMYNATERGKEVRANIRAKYKASGRAREQVSCECGTMVSRRNIASHKKTKKHLDAMEQMKSTH